MLRIYFTAENLIRLRMTASLGPVSESAFALRHLTRGTGADPFRRWRQQARRALGTRLGEFEQLANTDLTDADMSWLHRRQPGMNLLEGRDRRRLIMPVLDFYRRALLPYWGTVSRFLEAERDIRGRIVIAHGVERLLGTLHPQLRWNAPVLEMTGGPDREIHLDDRGLLLSPSFFLYDRACSFVDGDADNPPALIYAMQLDEAMVWSSMEPQEDALGALVGYTRAAALQALTDSCTTGELSQRLGISLAGASKHAKVLRKAGLITTARNRNTALHTLTSLGVALLQNRTETSLPTNELIGA